MVLLPTGPVAPGAPAIDSTNVGEVATERGLALSIRIEDNLDRVRFDGVESSM
jgi:hypothetical protein